MLRAGSSPWVAKTAKALVVSLALQMSPQAMGAAVQPVTEGVVWTHAEDLAARAAKASGRAWDRVEAGFATAWQGGARRLEAAGLALGGDLGGLTSSWRGAAAEQLASLAPGASLSSWGSTAALGPLLASAEPQSLPPSPPRVPRRSAANAKPPAPPVALAAGAEAGLTLLPGLNLVSLPLDPVDTDPAAVLAPIAGQIAAVFAYDACDTADPWKVYDPASPATSDLTVLDHRSGLWVEALSSAQLPLTGDQPGTTQIELCTGWNLVGYPLPQARSVGSALASIEGKYQRVFGFDVTDAEDPWEVYDVAVPSWANDLEVMQPGRGYWILATEDTTLTFENTGEAPVVSFVAPADLDEVTAPTLVLGTIESNSLERWTLSYAPSGEPGAEFAEIATGNAPGTLLPLGTFDPTVLLNGMYDLKLEAVDYAGQTVEATISVVVAGQMKIGNFTLSFTDLSVPLSGLAIEIVRTYDSRDKQQRDFGFGWSLDIRQGSYRNNRRPGDGWRIVNPGGPFGLPCQSVLETKSHLTTVRLSDQESYRFRLQLGSAAVVGGGCIAEAGFAAVDGTFPGSSLTILGDAEVFYANESDVVRYVDSQEVFEPQKVRLTTRDGRSFDFDLSAGVEHLEDANGNALTISDAGISHSGGASIAFERDSEGRITRIVDPLGNANEYSYDGMGDLVGFTDRSASRTSFEYGDDHYLLEILDPQGGAGVRNEYDDGGRLVATTDALGHRLEFSRDLEGRQEILTNRLGASRIVEYDGRGNVVREVDETGAVTVRSFDSDDNVVSETDPMGRTTLSTYGPGHALLSVKDASGAETTLSYDSSGRVATTQDPRGATTTALYDPSGNLTSITDSLGNQTLFSYDSRGNLATETDALGNSTTFVYDARGNLTRRTDAEGNVTTYSYDGAGRLTMESRHRTLADGTEETLVTRHTYDSNGRRLSTVRPDGTSVGQDYDSRGHVVVRRDPAGRETRYTYDDYGRLLTTQFPDGLTEQRGYDAEGRLVTRVDRAGRTTTMAYDPAGRLLVTTLPDGTTTSNTYDAAGQLTSETDGRGNVTTYIYDIAGRRTGSVDALGNAAEATYDAAGNPLSITDAGGLEVSFVYDMLGRRVATHFPDGTSTTTAYDALGRRVVQTDQLGRSTMFGYDLRSRLTSVTDTLGQVTAYSYDNLGNRLSQTDANGNTTSFAYDGLGRRTERRLPGGAAETFAYNPDGSLASRLDPNGQLTTYQYDSVGRQIRRTFADGTEVELSYSPTGRRTGVVDARGTTTYTYDALDRRLSSLDPDGNRLEYAYDQAGNRTRLSLTVGADTLTTTYTYDALNRLSTVADPDGGVFTYTYDAVGNRTSLSYPNGVTTDWAYDAMYQLTSLSTHDGAGALVQEYFLTLDAAGRRQRIAEGDGRTLNYSYDSLDRLISDEVLDALGALVYRQDFGYDAVGNRSELVETDSGGGVTSTSFQFDVRDRLVSSTSGDAYLWDANGSLLSRDTGGADTFTWDARNRLSRTVTADGTVLTMAYDAEGNLIRKERQGPDGSSSATRFVVDTTGALSQVVAEVDEQGGIETYYVRGNELLGLKRPSSGESKYFHGDTLGSVRCLTDVGGAVTDRYSYTAFGEELSHEGSDPQPFRFTAEPLDADSGLQYHRARWLSPAVGRFVSSDPFEGGLDSPGTLHRYAYALDQPTQMVDPSGLFGQISLGTSLAILSTLSILTNLAITGVVGARAAVEDDFSVDAALLTIGVGGQGRGLLGGTELDLLLYGDEIWVSSAVFIGFGPVAAFRSQKSGGAYYGAFGVVSGLSDPSELAGAGTVAVWPVAFLRLLRKAPFDQGRAWSLAMHLAKAAKNLRRFSLQVGLSSSGPFFLAIAPQYAALATTLTYNSQFLEIRDVFDRYGELFEELGVSDVLHEIRSLGSSASELGERGDELGTLAGRLF
ncbi:MAG: hypothetical protein KDD11_08730 [Acidobacteria bacterium]|nr:hypothetical protein [Acidobacteriota bacterium]